MPTCYTDILNKFTPNTAPIQLLCDPAAEPIEGLLSIELTPELFDIYQDLTSLIVDKFGLNYQWRYYKDGKAWLCKVTSNKKIIMWLSAWEGYIKASFFFTEKIQEGVYTLGLSPNIVSVFSQTEAIGRLIPLIVDISKKEDLTGIERLLLIKKGLSNLIRNKTSSYYQTSP